MLKLLSVLAICTFMLALGPSAQAVPAAGLHSVKASQSIVEHAYWRHHRHHRCWWRHGHRHCRWWW